MPYFEVKNKPNTLDWLLALQDAIVPIFQSFLTNTYNLKNTTYKYTTLTT